MSPTSPVIGVLALQGDVREHIASLEAAEARAVPVRRSSELDAVDAIVVPGGESTAMWKLAVAFDLLEPLRKRISAGMPAFGSCAGMIMLADEVLDAAQGQETIGGLDITVRRNAFGRQIDSFEADVEFDGLGAGGTADTLHAVFIRAPWVERAGPGVRVLARVAGAHGDPAPGRIVAVRQGSLLATSFHPELTRDRRVHAFFAGMVREAAANQ